MHPTQQLLMQEIVRDPGDIKSRQVYADWLTDHNDPLGQLIRVQCELSTLAEHDARWPELFYQQEVLKFELADRKDDFDQALPSSIPGFTWTTPSVLQDELKNGLPWMVEVAASDVAALMEIREQLPAPLTGLWIRGAKQIHDQASVSGLPPLAGIHWLDTGYLPIDDLAATLERSPDLTHLGFRPKTEDFPVLIDHPRFQQLRSLSVEGAWSSNSDVLQLADAQDSRIESLQLGLIRGSGSFVKIFESPLANRLKRLSFQWDEPDSIDDAREFWQRLSHTPFVEQAVQLDMFGDLLSDEIGALAFEPRHFAKLRILTMANDSGWPYEALRNWGHLGELVHLDICARSESSDLKELLSADLSSLVHFAAETAGSTQDGDSSAVSIAENTSLTKLVSLMLTSVSATGLRALCQSDAVSNLRKLTLMVSELGKQDVDVLLQSDKLRDDVHLEIDTEDWDDEDRQRLGERFINFDETY